MPNTPIALDLPLVDLHRHLDGTVRVQTVLDIARDHGITLPADTVEELRPYVQIQGQGSSLLEFLAKFDVLKQIFVDEEAIARVAEENIEDAAREGVDYLELRFSPAFMGDSHGVDVRRVMAACARGVKAGMARHPVQAQMIGIMSRHLGEDVCWQELEAAIDFMSEGVIAIDLAGDEGNFPGTRFVHHLQRAKDAGLHITVHAGEAAGPESVRQAVEQLHAERIGHGVNAIKDPALLDLLRDRRIAIESCPTSNLQTNTVATLGEHPLPAFVHHGLLVTLNTDDPTISGIDLRHEYRVARDQLGLTEAELRQLQRNGVEAAFLSDSAKQALFDRKRVVQR